LNLASESAEKTPLLHGSAVKHETVSGIATTKSEGERYVAPISTLADYATLCKLRVTSMVVLTAWAGFYLAAKKTGVAAFSWTLLETLAGVGLVASGAAAMNQVMEREADGKMSRTKARPLAAGRMSRGRGTVTAMILAFTGTALLAFATNLLTGALALLTAASYCFVYTPLKKIGPISTFVGAFPGAMPAVLGWTAVSGRLEWQALALFAIVFCWQFPHFLSIAWLYREDYERAGILMLPVVDHSGRATVRQILFYGLALIPVSLAPFFLGMSGWIYFSGAIALGIAYLWFGVRLAKLKLPPTAAASKKQARQLLQASVIYLPLLLVLLMATRTAA
jgi:protoheme IX farnesyltransferase